MEIFFMRKNRFNLQIEYRNAMPRGNKAIANERKFFLKNNLQHKNRKD